MSDAERWIYLDEREPEPVRPLGRDASSLEERESFIADLLPQLDPHPVSETAKAAPAPPAAPVPRPAPLRTAPMPATPPGAASPFLPPGAFPPKPRAPPTIPCPVMKVGSGTTPARDDSIERAVAAVRAGRSKPAVVAVPALSLDHYAWLCAEMAASPEQAEPIRGRYQVLTLAAHEALNAHWPPRLLNALVSLRWTPTPLYPRSDPSVCRGRCS
jgi:hypothetical protein